MSSKFDLGILLPKTDKPEGQLDMALVSDKYPSGVMVGGTQKLVQFVALALLTRKGSMPGDPNFGSSFLSRVPATRSLAEGLIAGAFSVAANEILALAAAKMPNASGSEKLVGLEYLGSKASPTSLQLSVRIITEDGTSDVVIQV